MVANSINLTMELSSRSDIDVIADCLRAIIYIVEACPRCLRFHRPMTDIVLDELQSVVVMRICCLRLNAADGNDIDRHRGSSHRPRPHQSLKIRRVGFNALPDRFLQASAVVAICKQRA